MVLESLIADGITLPEDLDYSKLSSQLTVPSNLYDLAKQNKIGLVMLKIVEIIGEDNISDFNNKWKTLFQFHGLIRFSRDGIKRPESIDGCKHTFFSLFSHLI